MAVRRESYLVTGGAGFLGSHTAAALLERGQRVRVLDNLSAGNGANLTPWQERIDFQQGDITNHAAVRAALDGIDVVIHLAGLRTVKSGEDPQTTWAVNDAATGLLLNLAAAAKVRRLVYASTAGVYGGARPLPWAENGPAEPVSAYGQSKLAAERRCREYANSGSLETVSLRYFNVYGPRQDPRSKYSGVISAFITALLENQPCPILGDGHQSRDFIYIEDALAATLAACIRPGISGAVINVGSGAGCTIRELAHRLGSLLGKDLPPRHLPARPGDTPHRQADIRRLQALLGITPRVDLAQGLARTVAWVQSQG